MEPVSLKIKAVGIYASLILAAAQNQFSAGLAQPGRKLFGTENQGVLGWFEKKVKNILCIHLLDIYLCPQFNSNEN